MRIVESSRKGDQNQLLKAFPSYLHQDVLIVFDMLFTYKFSMHSYYHHEVKLNGEHLVIPCRIYCNKPEEKDIEGLTDIQSKILYCILLNHNNGFLRQNTLEKLIGTKDYFVTPFIFKLIGEYIIEITDVIYKERIDWLENFIQFMDENRTYAIRTESRMISYWNAYYRYRCPRIKGYVGYKLMKEIKYEYKNKLDTI